MTHTKIREGQANDRVAELLDRLPQRGPEHSWEGALQGVYGSAGSGKIEFKATIAFHGELIEGTGRVSRLAQARPEWDDSLVLSGSRREGAVNFDIWLTASAFGRSAFSTVGQLSADGREMTGDWSVGCFDPAACGCKGGGGTYRMTRID